MPSVVTVSFGREPWQSVTVVRNDRDIMAWYKFRLLRTLSRRPPGRFARSVNALTPQDFPYDLLPLQEDEFLLHMLSGTTVVDGVEITRSVQDYPDLSIGEHYLLFLSFGPESKLAGIPLGGRGDFQITEQKNLRPLIDRDIHPIAIDLETRFQSHLPYFEQSLPGHRR